MFKKSIYTNNISFCDFETVTTNTNYYKEHQDTCITMWVWTTSANNAKIFKGTNLGELINIWGNFKQDWVVYFHNLKFDGRFVWTYLLKNGWTLFNGNYDANKSSTIDGGLWIDKSKNCFKINGDGANIYSIDLYYSNKRHIVLKCSYKLLPISIAQMGNCLGVSKHNETTMSESFYDVEPQSDINKYPSEYVEYAIRDVEILKRFYIEKFVPFLESIYNTFEIEQGEKEKPPLTIGGLSQHIQFTYLSQKTKININWDLFINGASENIARQFYKGGLTLYNDNTLKKPFENGCYIDINSAYPNAMCNMLPYGEHLEYEPSHPHIKWVHIRCRKAKIKHKKGLKPLFNWKGTKSSELDNNNFVDGCIDILYDFDAYYMWDELQVLEQFYDMDYDIIKTYYTKTFNYLEYYTRTLYKYKENATDDGFKQLVKLLLNNGYGKYGQNTCYDYLYVCRDEQDYIKRMNNPFGKQNKFVFQIRKQNKEYYKGEKVTIDNHLYNQGVYLINYKRTNNNDYYNPNVWIASAITAYNRIFLMKAFLECDNNNGNVLYCDTDSMILLNGECVNNPNNEIVRLHKSKLGYWGVELENVSGYIHNKKIYDVSGTNKNGTKTLQKAKGINKNVIGYFMKESRNDDDYIELQDGKRYMRKCPSGWVLDTKDIIVSNNPLKHKRLKGIKNE